MDGVLLTDGYNEVLEKGNYPDIPYMLGSCLNDMTIQPGTDGRNSSIYCGCVNWSLLGQLHGRKPAYVYQFCRPASRRTIRAPSIRRNCGMCSIPSDGAGVR